MRRTRLISLLLVLVMAFGLLPTLGSTAFAAPDDCIVTFDGDFVDDYYETVPVPAGSTLSEGDLPVLDDIDEWHFAGWSEYPVSTREDRFNPDTEITEDLTLYAIWEYKLDELAVYIRTPFAGEPATVPDAMTVGWYGDADVDTESLMSACWWDDRMNVGTYGPNAEFHGEFEAGKTYYGAVRLLPRWRRCFTQETEFRLCGGAEYYTHSVFDKETNSARLYFSVTIPEQKQVEQLELFVDQIQPLTQIQDGPARLCMTSGVIEEPIDCWWESLDDVGQNYDTMLYGEHPFESGKTYYSYFELFPSDEDYPLPAAPEVTLYGGTVERVETVGDGDYSYLHVVFSVQVPEVYGMTVLVEGETPNGFGAGAFRDDLEPFWSTLIDGPNVIAGQRTFTAKARHGYHFDGWYDCTQDNEPVLLTKDPVLVIEHEEYQFITCRFAEGEESKLPIPEIRLTAALPKAGDRYTYPEPAAALDGSFHCTLERAIWYNEYGISPEEGIEFQAGSAYFIGLSFIAEHGYQLDENTKVYVNGELVEALTSYNEEEWGTMFRYTVPADNPFDDVEPEDYYGDAVLWAVNHEPQITNGTEPGKFSPNAKCTRGQVVTFLWRAKGCPEVEGSGIKDQGSGTVADGSPVQNPFDDIKADDYYFKAVLWAVENGITTGTGNGKFSPNQGCTRGQVVTFLWRTEGCPEAEGSGIKDQGSGAVADGSPVQTPFEDIKADDYYFKAVLWAVENNITQGTDPGKFSPNMTCTRAQIVTFLYRDLAA